jgi:predicted CopG family antitoxin
MILETNVNQILESKGYMLTFGSYHEPLGLVDKKWTVGPNGQKYRHFYGMLDRGNYDHIMRSSKDAIHVADRIEKFLTEGESFSDPIDTLVERKVQEQLQAILGNLSKEALSKAKRDTVEPVAEPAVLSLRERVIADLENRPGVARTKDGRIHESVIKAAMNRYEVEETAKAPKTRIGVGPKKSSRPFAAVKDRVLKNQPKPVHEPIISHDEEVEAMIRAEGL